MAKCSLGCKGGITGDESSSRIGNGTKPAGTDSTEESRQRGTSEAAMHICDERSIRNVADGEESRMERDVGIYSLGGLSCRFTAK